MTTQNLYPASSAFMQQAFLKAQDYDELYQRAVSDPQRFWAEQAENTLDWFKPWDKVHSGDFQQVNYRWFEGGKLNVAYNCLDRHLEDNPERIAIIWEGDDPSDSRQITYRELHQQVCRFANVLLERGVYKGSRVCIYMPMIPEAAIAMLACARIGAIHSVVFGGFSAHALQERILDANCHTVITADAGVRGGKSIALKNNVDVALNACPSVNNVIVVQHQHADINWYADRDCWYHELMAKASDDCPAREMDAEDPLFILYTSGSTGKPKGALHTSGGYLLHTAMSHRFVFDYHAGDVYWCTADIGWITGHSYIVYGPLANGATTVMFEGTPHYPDASRFWQIIEKHRVNIFYTAPTAIRALMREGDAFVNAADRSSLRLLGTVGEPINPEVWEWYYNIVGEKRCPIVDTWWQTETGGIMIAPLPAAIPAKPGSATKPFFGIEPVLLDDEGKEIVGVGEGKLAIRHSWPGQMRTIYGDHQRFIDTYFQTFPGYYFTGDGARRDEDGYYWITGRVDDVINVSGHRLGTAEIESALVGHPDISEAAVVAVPHDIKGQAIYAYVTPKVGIKTDDGLEQALKACVRQQIGAIAIPEVIVWSEGLPKTRSGKIMRRILRKIAQQETDLGDISTLSNPEVIDGLLARSNHQMNK